MTGALLIGVREEVLNLNNSEGSDVSSLKTFVNYLLPSYFEDLREVPT